MCICRIKKLPFAISVCFQWLHVRHNANYVAYVQMPGFPLCSREGGEGRKGREVREEGGERERERERERGGREIWERETVWSKNPMTHPCSYQLSHRMFHCNVPSLSPPFQMTAICRGR